MLEKTGNYLHLSAADHAGILAQTLTKYDVDKDRVAAFLPPHRDLHPMNLVHEHQYATKVIHMDVDDDLIASLKRELVLRSKIDAAISDMAAGAYFPLSTQFEHSIYFLPSAQRFYNRNRHLIEEHFPEIETAVVNAFVVTPGKKPYGAHSAGAIAFQIPKLAENGFAYPKIHKSFHCALTPTPLHAQPLAIWEKVPSDSPNTSYLWEQIHAHDLTPEEADEVDKAYYLHDSSQLNQVDVVSIRDYLLCKYWEKKYTADPSDAEGYYYPCQPGDALVFDNYKAHGDGTLPPAEHERVTIDIRCFSRVEYPNPKIESGIDLMLNAEKKRAEKKANLEFLMLAAGYDSLDEFMDLVFPDDRDAQPYQMITDGAFGVYNKPKYYVLERDMEAHYERILKLYDRIEAEGGFSLPPKAEAIAADLMAR